MAPSRGRGPRGPPVEPDEAPADAVPPPTPFSALVRDVLLHALPLCDDGDTGADLVRLAAVDRGTRALLHAGDDYFADVARAAWGVRGRTPVDVHGRSVATFKECVASHERVLGSLGGHGRAAARAWHRLRAVLPPAVRATLSPPLADDVLARFRRCGWHDSVIAYAAVCDGQATINFATNDVMRTRDAPLGLLGALPAPAAAATVHLCPIVTARTRSTLRPPGGQASRPVWVPLAIVPASAADAVAAAIDGRPALLDRVIEVNVGTGAVRVTSRGSSAAMRIDGKWTIVGWLENVAARLEEAGLPPVSIPPPTHSILDLLPAHVVNIGDHAMNLTLRVLPTPVGAATPLRCVYHAVVSLALGPDPPTTPLRIRCIHVRRTHGVGGNDSWVLRLDADLNAGTTLTDWWPMMAVPPNSQADALGLAFEVEAETREGVRVRWKGEREVRVAFGGVGV